MTDDIARRGLVVVGWLEARGYDVYQEVELRSGGIRADIVAKRGPEEVTSRRWNARPMLLAGRLRPEHKTSARAGSQTGGRWSRWRDTCAKLARVVAAEPGLSIKAAMQLVEHHYVSSRVAVSTMESHVREGRVEGVRLEGGALYPEGPA